MRLLSPLIAVAALAYCLAHGDLWAAALATAGLGAMLRGMP